MFRRAISALFPGCQLMNEQIAEKKRYRFVEKNNIPVTARGRFGYKISASAKRDKSERISDKINLRVLSACC